MGKSVERDFDAEKKYPHLLNPGRNGSKKKRDFVESRNESDDNSKFAEMPR